MQDHVNKGSSDFMEGSYSLHVRILDALVAEGIAVVEMFLIYHVALRDQVFITVG